MYESNGQRMKHCISAALAVAALIGTLSLGGCADNADGDFGNSPESVELRVWGSQDDQSILRQMCADFAAAHPERTYEFRFGVVGEGDAKKMILDDPDAAADVFHFANDQLSDLVSAGALAQIGGSYRETVMAENGEGAVEAAQVDGRLYAFPATADNGYFLYYNRQYFDHAPATMDEILDACREGRRFAMKLSDSWYCAAFFLSAGCEFAADKTIDWNSDAGLSAAKAMNALCRDSRFVNFGADYDASMIAGFGDGSVIAAVSGTWTAEKIAAEIGEENLGASKLPEIRIDGTLTQMRGFAGYKLVGVNAGTKYPEDAVKLAAWITNEENQLMRFEKRAAGPSNTAAAKSEAVQANTALAALSDQLQHSISQNYVPASWWTAGEGFGTDLVSGNILDEQLPAMLDTLVATVNNPVG